MKIKKVPATFCLVLFVFLTVQAAQAQVRFGVRAGGNVSNAVWSSGAYNAIAGYQGGVATDFGFLGNFSVQTALMYTSRGYNMETKYNTLGGKMEIFEKFRTNYMEVPVLVLYNFKLGESLRLFTGGGPYWARAINGTIKFNNGIAGDCRSRAVVFNDNKKLPVDGGYNRMDSGLIGAVGLETKNWAFGLNYQHGLVDIGPNHFNAFRTRLSTRSLSLSAGYWFGKAK